MNFKRPLILASKSPRRKQLLEQAGFEFSIKTKDTTENYPAEMPAKEVPLFLAAKKAAACRTFIQDQEIVLAADTIVIQDGIIYEKPKDRADAVRILQQLSGRMHLVITGVCLLAAEKEKAFSSQAKVYLDPLTITEIDYYIDTYQPYDKAGAYAIQEWIGLCKISKIEGTYATIMGLPVDLVYRHLINW